MTSALSSLLEAGVGMLLATNSDNYKYTYIHSYKHIHIHTYIHIHIHSYIHIHIHTHTFVFTYIHTYIFTYIHTYIHTFVFTCIHTYIHAYSHTYIHTYIHIHIHTYIPWVGGRGSLDFTALLRDTDVLGCTFSLSTHTYIHTKIKFFFKKKCMYVEENLLSSSVSPQVVEGGDRWTAA